MQGQRVVVPYVASCRDCRSADRSRASKALIDATQMSEKNGLAISGTTTRTSIVRRAAMCVPRVGRIAGGRTARRRGQRVGRSFGRRHGRRRSRWTPASTATRDAQLSFVGLIRTQRPPTFRVPCHCEQSEAISVVVRTMMGTAGVASPLTRNRAAVSFSVIPAKAEPRANARDQQRLGSRLRGAGRPERPV